MASKWVACLLVTIIVQSSLASRSPDEGNEPTDSLLRGARGPLKASTLEVRSSGILAQQQAEPAGTNLVYSVDYSDENDSSYTTDEADERAMEQVMTYSTYFPGDVQMQQQHARHGKPCHHHQQHQQHMHPWQMAIHPQEVAASAAAAAAADADVLVAAASHAWQKAQRVAARLAAADAEETAELVAELEATMDKLTDAENTANEIIDHRWDRSDHGLGGSLWSELVADYINPARRYFSGMDDYIPADIISSSYSSQQDAYEVPDYEDTLGLLPADPAQDLSIPQHIPAGYLAGQHAAAAHDNFDIGLLILPEDNAANNLALFGVRTPAEVAAAAAAAAADGAEAEGPWPGMLEWLSASPYLSSFDSIDPQQAAAVLLVGCTMMVFIAFLFSIVDLRVAVHSAAAVSSSSSRSARMPAGAMPLRTRKSAFGCSAVAAAAAAAAAAMGSGCGVQGPAAADELSQPLLIDVGDDVEAAVVQVQPSAVLAPAMQKFYNPMHYQQLPDSE